MPIKKLPPPKGTAAATHAAAAAAESEQDRITRLSSRYQEHVAEPPAPARPAPAWPQSGSPAAEAPAAAPPARPADRRPPASRTRPEPEGMTRKTLYMSLDAAAALESAVAQIQRATGGTVSKHAALAALIAAGVAQTDTVTQALREEVLQSLGGGQ